MTEETVLMRDRPLAMLFSRAATDDLSVLADIITDNSEGRLALDAGVKKRIIRRKNQGTLYAIAPLLASEICRFGGNTIVNVFRSGELDYREIASDVASELGGSVGKKDSIFDIEEKVIALALKQYAKKTPCPKDWSSYSLLLTSIVENLIRPTESVAEMMMDIGIKGAGFFGKLAPALRTGPLGFGLIVGAAAGYKFSAPALRVTVPAVIHIANIRRCQIEVEFSNYERSLRACL
jgi:uncharacterized protein YaaW (UPF0174 family)